MAENNYLTQDNELPSELITKKAESLGIDRGTFQTVYPQIRKSLTDKGVDPSDANLGILLDMNSRDARNSPQAQVKETVQNQSGLNQAVPWANEIDEAYGPKALDEYKVKIKEWESKSGVRKAFTDNLANIGDIAQPGGTNLYDQNQKFYQDQKDRIARDTLGYQELDQKRLKGKTDQINASRDSSQAGLKNLADNTSLSLGLQAQDPNSPQSKYYQKIAKAMLPEFSEEDLANMPAALVQQFIQFKQAQGKLSTEQLKILAEAQKAQAEAGKAGAESGKAIAEADKARAEASNTRTFTENITKQGNNPNGLLVQTGPTSLSVNPVAAESGKQNLDLGQRNAILNEQIKNMMQVLKDAKEGKIDFGKVQIGSDPSFGGYKPNIINDPKRVAANERADNIANGELFVKTLQQGGRGLSDNESKAIKETFPTRTSAKDEYIDRLERNIGKLIIEKNFNDAKLKENKSDKPDKAPKTESNSNTRNVTLKDGRRVTIDSNNKIVGTW